MKFSTFLPLSLLSLLPLTSAQSQATSTFIEPKTNISFQAFTDATGYTFGIALPTGPSTDFIGIIQGKGKGWAGVSLGGAMVNKLLIAAWPSGTGATAKIVASFRETTKIGNPPEATGTYTMTPIAAGTYVNTTSWTYTFLCKSCILTNGKTFAANATSDVLGWAFATAAPTTPASKGSALMKHASQGNYAMGFMAARNAKFASWVTLAGAGAPVVRREFVG